MAKPKPGSWNTANCGPSLTTPPCTASRALGEAAITHALNEVVHRIPLLGIAVISLLLLSAWRRPSTRLFSLAQVLTMRWLCRPLGASHGSPCHRC